MIEVLVVLVILGLSIALIVARGPARSTGFDLRATADDIAQHLRLARSEAIATDRTTSFNLDTLSHRYDMGESAVPQLPADIALSMTTATGGRPQRVIIFAPDGSSSGGRVVVLAGAHRLQIVVDWLTGRVSVSNAP